MKGQPLGLKNSGAVKMSKTIEQFNNVPRAIGIPVAGLTLSGCTMIPKYERPRQRRRSIRGRMKRWLDGQSPALHRRISPPTRQCCFRNESTQVVLTGLLPGQAAGKLTPFCSVLLKKPACEVTRVTGRLGVKGVFAPFIHQRPDQTSACAEAACSPVSLRRS